MNKPILINSLSNLLGNFEISFLAELDRTK